ncbi:Gfo/Idh/MocA family protein [Bacillus sp. 2205SS5-2]|uniref:Gfo/Idh/MocA family protein n=1 Tax=Bacillus sp. 2205SS5-2 TaxID=3109031 RepID=UPI003004CD9D
MTQSSICFIGAGFHATTNIYPSVVEAGANILAIATRNLDRSKEALLRYGSKGTPYDNYIKMLENEPCDGVIVVAQPSDHPSLVMDCIKAGKNVYVEKPLGMTEEEALQLARAAEEADVVLMVGFMKRYSPIYTKLKTIIESCELGEPRSFEVRFAVDSTPFCTDDEQFLKFAAIHMVDLVRYLFGDVAKVTGFKNNSGSHISQSISLKFHNGVVGSLYFTGMTAWSRESENLLVTFDNGFAFADEVNSLKVHRSQSFEELPWKALNEMDTIYTPSASPMSGTMRDLYLRGFVGEIEHFLHCCREGDTPLSNGHDNVKTMALCDEILLALE